MTSPKKITANRKNARASTGPKNPEGKNRSSLNALKHGLYSRELGVRDEEKPELQLLRGALRRQYLAETPLQELAFEEILSCAWRCKLALRVEKRRLQQLLASDADEVPVNDPEGNATILRWYASGRGELRAGIRFLRDLRSDVNQFGQVRDSWKEPLVRGFGAEFLDLLTQWTPMNHTAVMMANHLVQHRQTFGDPDGSFAKFENSEPTGEVREKLIIDPQQGMQMVLKIIDQQILHLETLATTHDQRQPAARAQDEGPVDFAPRFFTSATRDLHRAVAWYSHLKKNNL